MDIASLLSSAGTGGVGGNYDGLVSGAGGGEQFSNILNKVLEMAEDTDTQDKASDLSLLTGGADDIAGLLIDSQKAEVALGLTVQIRNKLMDAYNEVMNMQV